MKLLILFISLQFGFSPKEKIDIKPNKMLIESIEPQMEHYKVTFVGGDYIEYASIQELKKYLITKEFEYISE